METRRVPVLAPWANTIRGYAIVDEDDYFLVLEYILRCELRENVYRVVACRRDGTEGKIGLSRLILGLKKSGDSRSAVHFNRNPFDCRKENLGIKPYKRIVIKSGKKLCRGPLHKEGGEWLSLTGFYINKNGKQKGKPRHRCIDCFNAQRWGLDNYDSRGMVPLHEVMFVFNELARKIGKMETCRRLGYGSSGLYSKLNRPSRSGTTLTTRMIRKRTVKKAMELLVEVRQNDEIRSRRDIRYGAAKRGLPETRPKNKSEFNYPYGDSDNDTKRRQWANSDGYRIRQNKRRNERLKKKSLEKNVV